MFEIGGSGDASSPCKFTVVPTVYLSRSLRNERNLGKFKVFKQGYVRVRWINFTDSEAVLCFVACG